ncbi:Lysophospholipase/Carboxylesterase [Chlorociboria aeruginascens]|nr:Lysophospholipase/Carboxylesterase [Chlorociboria aeruginascens]
MAEALRAKHPEESLHILVAKRNSGSFTYDGIELGGERVCAEIEEEVDKLAKAGQEIKKISIIGYSLGGLVARYCVGLLDNKGFFEKVKPINLHTFATPHLGVRTPLRGWHNNLWNILGARTLSASGRQLFTIDNFRDTGRPLLEILADPESIFIKGLAKFERRTLYANIVNDRSAVYYTTGISKTDPFTELDSIKVNYLKGYEDVLLDPEMPFVPIDDEESISTFYARFLKSNKAIIGRLPFLAAMSFLLPVAILVFLVNSGIQSVRSERRIRLHEKGLAGIQPGTYRVPLLLTEMREAVEDVYENLNSAQSNEYLDTETDEEAAHEAASSEHSQPTKKGSGEGPEKSALHQPELPTLALATYQFRMIQTLNSVGWRKYPVYIHKNRHSHAAIIVRVQKPSFSEGKVVFRHWLDEEFII